MIENDDKWSLPLTGLRVGASVVPLDSISAVFSTGSQKIYLPKTLFAAFKSEVKSLKGFECTDASCYTQAVKNSCDSIQLESVWLKFKTPLFFEIPSSQLLSL